jgi:hypothetical protein
MASIYIASSWRNQHAVEMMTYLLRQRGHEVMSFVENNYGEGHNHIAEKPMPFEEWVQSPESDQSFKYDTSGATASDLVIYIGPSGKDAAAECGMAWASGIPIIGLHAKSEDFGLMRKMMAKWCYRFTEVLEEVEAYDAIFAAISRNRKRKEVSNG